MTNLLQIQLDTVLPQPGGHLGMRENIARAMDPQIPLWQSFEKNIDLLARHRRQRPQMGEAGTIIASVHALIGTPAQIIRARNIQLP